MRSIVDVNSSHQGSGLLSTIASVPQKVFNTAQEIVKLPKTVTGFAINKAIDLLPLEIHFPNYKFCGPGTKLQKRLARHDQPVNPLDEACKQHDIAYYNSSDSKTRAEADRNLAERAWERVKSPNASLAEKAASLAVVNIMKLKNKVGGKLRKTRRRRKVGKGAYLEPYKSKSGCGVKKKQRKRGHRRRHRRRY